MFFALINAEKDHIVKNHYSCLTKRPQIDFCVAVIMCTFNQKKQQ